MQPTSAPDSGANSSMPAPHRKPLSPLQDQQTNKDTLATRPVQILITSNDNQQIARLNDRCQQLEAYCRDLIKTNKLLDLENRLCISQILNLNNASQGGANQLNNFVGALQMLKKQNQVYGPR